MKRFLFLLLLISGTCYGQTTYYIRADSTRLQKIGGNNELILENSTKAVKGLLTNYGNGRTRFIGSRISNDTLFVGMDTLIIPGGSTPTWQQTLTAGSTLSSNNAVSMGSTTFTMTRVNSGWTNVFDIGSKTDGHIQLIGRQNTTDTCYVSANAEDNEAGMFSLDQSDDISARVFVNPQGSFMEAQGYSGGGGTTLQLTKTAFSLTGGDVGIGTNSPTGKVNIIKTTEQLRIGYDASNYYKTTVASNGAVTWDAVGGGGFKISDSTNFNGQPIENYSAKYNNQTGTTYTLVAADNGKILTFDNGSDITLTVPAGLPAGFTCTVVQLGAGEVVFTASSTTLHNRSSFTKTAGQYAVAAITMYASNTFIFGGDCQ